jgi:hypothetical protein
LTTESLAPLVLICKSSDPTKQYAQTDVAQSGLVRQLSSDSARLKTVR